MIDILIPTYNRAEYLQKNIEWLETLATEEEISHKLHLVISNNCSTDDTDSVLEATSSLSNLHITTYSQEENIGLERNVVFLLEKATSKFIMYLGDDDLLPRGYLSFVLSKIDTEPDVSAIIPGTSALYHDGSTKVQRKESFDIEKFKRGFRTCLRLSHLGHQLSGILVARSEILETYGPSIEHRNIYPFIYFLSFNILRGSTYYAPVYSVLVFHGNAKDWEYDHSGLLTEIFKNYNLLYPKSLLKRNMLKSAILLRQSQRLRIGKNLKKTTNSLLHLLRDPGTELPTKCLLLTMLPYLVFLKFVSAFRKKESYKV